MPYTTFAVHFILIVESVSLTDHVTDHSSGAIVLLTNQGLVLDAVASI
jgi:hypothetical protein